MLKPIPILGENPERGQGSTLEALNPKKIGFPELLPYQSANLYFTHLENQPLDVSSGRPFPRIDWFQLAQIRILARGPTVLQSGELILNSSKHTNSPSLARPWHLERIYAEQYQDRSVVDAYHLRPYY